MGYRKHYGGDPRWLTARFESRCHRCHAPIRKGERAFYYPNGKRILCDSDACGQDASREFSAAAFAEDCA